MAWWIWTLVGLGLLVVEIITPGGFFTLFFGAGALVVGMLVALGIGGSVAVQWLLFSILSVISLLVFRSPLLRWVASKQKPMAEVDTLVGQAAIANEDIPAGGAGKAELRGAAWNARNGTSATIAKGQRCKVEKVDGLTLWIQPE